MNPWGKSSFYSIFMGKIWESHHEPVDLDGGSHYFQGKTLATIWFSPAIGIVCSSALHGCEFVLFWGTLMYAYKIQYTYTYLDIS